MIVPFEEMPDNARLWIYQAERPLEAKEQDFVRINTAHFLNGWQAHGQPLKSAFEIKYGQFLIIAVDESHSQASGCSIDASVHLIKALESELGISFMTTSQVAFLKDEKIELHPFNQLKEKTSSNQVLPTTPMFDNTIKTVADYRSRWLVESKDSWVSRYFQ